MDFEPLIERKRRRYEELEREISSPGLFDDAKRAREVLREHGSTRELLDVWSRLIKTRRELEENREFASSDDKEMAEMASAEIPSLEAEIPLLERASIWRRKRSPRGFENWFCANMPRLPKTG